MFIEVREIHISVGSKVFSFKLPPEFTWFAFPQLIHVYTLLSVILSFPFRTAIFIVPFFFRVDHVCAPHF